MRGTMVATLVLALGACGEHAGWNPNYSVGERPYGTVIETPYTRYLAHREAALQGKAEPSRTIPIARPFKAPTAEDIAGPNLWQIIQREARVATGTPEPKAGAVVVVARAQAVPVVRRGPYPGSTPVLAQYAATMTQTPGTRAWPRRGGDPVRALQICRSYASVEAAQIGFIAHGGPERDPLGMDPDGDGLVCGWNPETWRPDLP